MTSPFLGLLVQKFGRMPLYYVISSSFGILSLVLFLTLPNCVQIPGMPPVECNFAPLIPMILLGLFLTFFTVVIWGSIAMTSPLEVIGAAYGIAYSTKNLFSMLTPLLAGYLLSVKK